MTALLSLLAAALIASANPDGSDDSGTEIRTLAPAPTSRPAGDAAPGLVTPFESWAGLDLELVRLPGATEPSDPSAGSA